MGIWSSMEILTPMAYRKEAHSHLKRHHKFSTKFLKKILKNHFFSLRLAQRNSAETLQDLGLEIVPMIITWSWTFGFYFLLVLFIIYFSSLIINLHLTVFALSLISWICHLHCSLFWPFALSVIIAFFITIIHNHACSIICTINILFHSLYFVSFNHADHHLHWILVTYIFICCHLLV